MEQPKFKIFELRRRRRSATSYLYEVFDGGTRVAFTEAIRNYVACFLYYSDAVGYGMDGLTGDPGKFVPRGDVVGYAFMRDIPTAVIPDFIRPDFVEWKALENTPTAGDRVRFDRTDGLYYARVAGREFGGWQTRALAEGGLLVEQRRAAAAADRTTPEPASSADEVAVLEMTAAAVLSGFVAVGAAGDAITSDTIHAARRVAVMAIDAAARRLLDELRDRVSGI